MTILAVLLGITLLVGEMLMDKIGVIDQPRHPLVAILFQGTSSHLYCL